MGKPSSGRVDHASENKVLLEIVEAYATRANEAEAKLDQIRALRSEPERGSWRGAIAEILDINDDLDS
jgi:hypothetical protein